MSTIQRTVRTDTKVYGARKPTTSRCETSIGSTAQAIVLLRISLGYRTHPRQAGSFVTCLERQCGFALNPSREAYRSVLAFSEIAANQAVTREAAKADTVAGPLRTRFWSNVFPDH